VIRSDEESLPIAEVPQLEDSPHDAEAFSLRGGVVLLCSRESSAPICDRMKQFTRFLLERVQPTWSAHASTSTTSCRLTFGKASTGGHNSAFRRSSNAAMATSVGGGRSGGISALVRASGASLVCKVFDKTLIDVAHAQEAFRLGLCSWDLGMFRSILVLVVHVQLPGADNVSEVLDLIGEPRALFQVEGNPGFAETVKNRVNVFDVLFRVCGEDDDIV